jgi:hypothetical protein
MSQSTTSTHTSSAATGRDRDATADSASLYYVSGGAIAATSPHHHRRAGSEQNHIDAVESAEEREILLRGDVDREVLLQQLGVLGKPRRCVCSRVRNVRANVDKICVLDGVARAICSRRTAAMHARVKYERACSLSSPSVARFETQQSWLAETSNEVLHNGANSSTVSAVTTPDRRPISGAAEHHGTIYDRDPALFADAATHRNADSDRSTASASIPVATSRATRTSDADKSLGRSLDDIRLLQAAERASRHASGDSNTTATTSRAPTSSTSRRASSPPRVNAGIVVTPPAIWVSV